LVTLAEAVYGQNNRRDILDGLVEDEIQLAGANEEEQQVRKSTRVTRKMRKVRGSGWQVVVFLLQC
jgi:hypothetical protein